MPCSDAGMRQSLFWVGAIIVAADPSVTLSDRHGALKTKDRGATRPARHRTPAQTSAPCGCANASDADARRPVMLVKLPRTGSSWLATVLTGVVDERHGAFEVEVGVGKSTPLNALSKKLRNGQSFSMEPMAAKCLDYGAVLGNASAARPLLLFLYRCNVPKLAISNAFSWELKRKRKACPTPDAGDACAENWPYGKQFPKHIDLSWFKNQIVCSRARTRMLHAVAEGVDPAAERRAVSFEALQADEAAVVSALSAAVSCDGAPPPPPPRRRRLHCGVATEIHKKNDAEEPWKDPCVKTVPDDLRALVSNFEEVADFLGAASPCLRAQFEEPGTSCSECADDYWRHAVCHEDTFRRIGKSTPSDACVVPDRGYPAPDAWVCPECERIRGYV